MSGSALTFQRSHHLAGEYFHTPSMLTLSFAFSRTNVEMTYDGARWHGTSLPGDIKVMPLGQLRIFRHSQACRFGHINIDADRLYAGGKVKGLERPHAVLRDAPLRQVLSALWAEGECAATALFKDAVAQAVIARLAELEGAALRFPGQRMPPVSLQRALDYLDAHLDRDISVAELAAVAALSPAHFATLFRNSIGEPPHRYHIRLRVERARVLLQQGMPPSAVAVAVGFYDHSHLGRHMRRVLGVSPSVFKPR